MSKTVLTLKNATRLFSGGAGVNKANLTIKQGEIVALVGLNGAGKTTLMKLALGMLRPTSGTIQIVGQPVNPHTSSNVWAQVGYFVDAPFVYPELTVAQNLDTMRSLQGVADTDSIERAITEFNLRQYADQKARTLSLGNRQRVGLAMSFLHAPRLIILDEPTNSLDPSGVIALRQLLRQRADEGAAILVSSHHLDEVARIADRIVMMEQGRIVADGEASMILKDVALFGRLGLMPLPTSCKCLIF